MNINSGPLTKEACYLLPAIDAALPASVPNTNLIIRLGALMDKVEKLELSIRKPPERSLFDEQFPKLGIKPTAAPP